MYVEPSLPSPFLPTPRSGVELTVQGDGREEALLKHLQSHPDLNSSRKDESIHVKSQRVLDAIHEFGKGENRYLMSVGETKGKQVEALIREVKPKVSHDDRRPTSEW